MRAKDHRWIMVSVCGVLLLFTGNTLNTAAQPSVSEEWTWMSGSSTVLSSGHGQPGVYGTLGQPAAQNTPGARSSASTWIDAAGRLWIFGGVGFDSGGNSGSLNDLWMFNPLTNQWTWMGGSDTLPPGSPGPTAAFGQPGVYGTLQTPAQGNIPGGRYNAYSWIGSNGHFWLAGGLGFDASGTQGFLNDIWQFDPITNEWAWMGGSKVVGSKCVVPFAPNPLQLCGQAGTYGTLGIAAAADTPGSRNLAATWVDRGSHLWLFGGFGFDSNGTYGSLNDLWEFDPSTNLWTWMGGNSVIGPDCTRVVGGSGSRPFCGYRGVYGTLGTAAASNGPGSRSDAASWTDTSGNFWLFGGSGFDASGNDGALNDLWKFNPLDNKWTWMAGNATVPLFTGMLCQGFPPCATGQPGVYGAIGVPSATNTPGGRIDPSSWTDRSGHLWLLGGGGFDANDTYGALNDLWAFDPSIGQWTWMGGSSTLPCTSSKFLGLLCGQPGLYGALDTPASTNSPGGRLSSSSWADNNGNFWLFGGLGYDADATQGYLNDLWMYQPAGALAPATIAPTFSPASGSYSAIQVVTISDLTPGATIYYTVEGTVPTTTSTQYTAPVHVSSSQIIKAIATAPGRSASSISTASYTINIPPADFSVASSPSSMTISHGQGGITSISIAPLNGFNSAVSFACTGLPTGTSCSFSPSTITPAGASASTTLTIATSANTTARHRNKLPTFPIAAVTCALACLGLKKRRRVYTLMFVAIGAVALALPSACGSGSSSGSGGGGSAIQPITSIVTVTAASGTLQHSTTISLTVN
jgi:N-acetylneuraminic acid mutarotase